MNRPHHTVIVKDVRGVALIRWVVRADDRCVYLTDAEGLAAIERGEETPRVMGFPSEDVFCCELGIANGQRPDWSKLSRWRPM